MNIRDYSNITDFQRETLEAYVLHGHHPGGFIAGILENNLQWTISHADDDSLQSLPAIAIWIYNRIPCECWGSKEAVQDWIDKGGIIGRGWKWKADWRWKR